MAIISIVVYLLVPLAHSIEQNNLLQENDLSKDNIKKGELGLDHGIEHNIGLKQHVQDIEGITHHNDATSFGGGDFDDWILQHQDVANDNLAVETHQAFVVTETAPKSFTVEKSTNAPSENEKKPFHLSKNSNNVSTKSKKPTLCLCEPPCQFTSDNNSSASDNSQCLTGRYVPRKDCPCCKVCARQEGESCGSPHQLCDKEFGLRCSEEKICVGEYLIIRCLHIL